MQKIFRSRLLRLIVPYFVLGLLLIIAFRMVTGIGFFAEHLQRFWSVVTPFFIGGVIAYILNLPCSAIERLYKKINTRFFQLRSRGLSVLTLAILTITLLVLGVNFVVPTVTRSVSQFIDGLEHYEATFRGWIETVDGWNLPFLPDDLDEAAVFALVFDFVETLDTDEIASSVMEGVGATARAFFNAILIIISSIYFLIEKDKLKDFLKRAIHAVTSSKANDVVLKYSRKLNHNFHMYIYTQTIDGIILGTLMTILLMLFQSPHALLLGIILGVVNYIPYFGSIFGTAFAVLVVAFTQGLPTAAVAAIFMFILQQFDGNFIQPKLMGGSFSLSPLLVIISVTIGMAYGGVLGMLVAIPIVAIFKDMADEYIAYREELKRNPPPPLPPEAYDDYGMRY